MSVVDNIHVLHIVSGDLWAGAEVQLYTLAKAQLNQQGVAVSVVALNHGRLEQELRLAGIDVTVLDESILGSLQILRQLIHVIREIRPDIIHTHRYKENILGSIAARLSGNIKSMRTAHGALEHTPDWYQIPKQLNFFLDRICGRFLQRSIVAVSDDLAGILEKDFPRNRIQIIENGIDISLISQSTNQADTRDKGGQAKLRIGIAGRLVPVKRVDLFIQAARQIIDDHPELEASFHIYGDGPLREELESLNQKLNTENHIHFEGHTNDMYKELQQLDVLVVTSDHEGLPMIALEAMALQIPLVAHATGGIPTLLDHGTCGVLVHNHSPAGYAEAIYQLAIDNKKRSINAQNAFNQVTTAYSNDHNADKYLELYKNLITQET